MDQMEKDQGQVLQANVHSLTKENAEIGLNGRKVLLDVSDTSEFTPECSQRISSDC